MRAVDGVALRKVREARGFTQAELAAEVDVTAQHISGLEREVSYGHPTTIALLADVLGVPVEVISRERPTPVPTVRDSVQRIDVWVDSDVYAAAKMGAREHGIRFSDAVAEALEARWGRRTAEVVDPDPTPTELVVREIQEQFAALRTTGNGEQ